MRLFITTYTGRMTERQDMQIDSWPKYCVLITMNVNVVQATATIVLSNAKITYVAVFLVVTYFFRTSHNYSARS